MNSQNTPVHIRLWHRDFWLMAIANLLLTMSVYMLVPTLPHWLTDIHGLTAVETGFAMGAFGFGLFGFGAFASFLVQRYRRNQVCVWAALSMAAMIGILYYVDIKLCQFMEFWFVLLERFLFGAFFGLAQMVLTSTLIIDTCESYQRTEANYSASWFGRFALSLGPLSGLLLQEFAGFDFVFLRIVYRGYGKQGNLKQDEKFIENIRKVKETGLKVGAYVFSQAKNEVEALEEAKFAIKELGGKIEKVEKIILPDSDMERNIIIIRKVKETPKNYPRKAGMPSKQPL